MRNIRYKAYLFEALKITFFCLVVTGLFKLLSASNEMLLIVFNMAVMSSAATFSIEQKHLNHVTLGSSVMVVSIVAGGILGYYTPLLAKLLTILYAGLAFYLPRSRSITNIFVTSSLMFLIFTALPFDWKNGVYYALDGLMVIAIFIIFYWLFDRDIQDQPKEKFIGERNQTNQISAINVVLSLSIAWIISYLLSIYSQLTHLYWIELTALVIIQASQQKTIHTSLKRILVNVLGAIIIVILFNYVMPPDFWTNFSLLVLFLFSIFFFGFSYAGRTLFIELFVLGFTHLLGDYQNAVALDRVILTLIGGTVVIAITPISYFLVNRFTHPRIPFSDK